MILPSESLIAMSNMTFLDSVLPKIKIWSDRWYVVFVVWIWICPEPVVKPTVNLASEVLSLLWASSMYAPFANVPDSIS